MIQFTDYPSEAPLAGKLLYRDAEYSFDFIPTASSEVQKRSGKEGHTSLLVGSLQVEVGISTNFLLFVWGYHPYQIWKQQSLSPPLASPGLIKMLHSEPLEPGISIPLMEDRWSTLYDIANGWLCLGNPELGEGSKSIEFATNTIAVIENEILRAIWLHPIRE